MICFTLSGDIFLESLQRLKQFKIFVFLQTQVLVVGLLLIVHHTALTSLFLVALIFTIENIFLHYTRNPIRCQKQIQYNIILMALKINPKQYSQAQCRSKFYSTR